MPTFIEKSNCRGNRPTGVVGLHHTLRSDITGALLRDRSVPRFLVAPMGYGKSSCAYEYAQVVFGFDHVFWIKCDSPCFIRDLDSGSIAPQISKADASAKLVVFDDVPHLDQDRLDSFCKLLAELTEQGIETIITCIPSLDVISAQYVDKIVLRAADLAPSDDEVEIERMRGNLSKEEADRLLSSQRAACLLWGDSSASAILKGLAMEELPSELELIIFCMLVLGSGRIDDLRGLLPESRLDEDASYLASMFPYLGIELDGGTFHCISAAPADILSQAKLSPIMLGKASLQGDCDGLALELADRLLAKGEEARAANLLKAFGSRSTAATWLISHGWELLCRPQALSVESLAAHCKVKDSQAKSAIAALSAWALAMLGDHQSCARIHERLMRTSSTGWREVAAVTIAYRIFGEGSDQEAIALGIDRALALRSSVADSGEGEGHVAAEQRGIDWDALLDLEALRFQRDDAPRYGECFMEWATGLHPLDAANSNAALRNALLISGAWFLEQLLQSVPESLDDLAARDMQLIEFGMPVVSVLARELKTPQDDGSLTWPESLAVLALQAVTDYCPYGFDESVSPRMVASARMTAVKLLAQADEYRKSMSVKEAAKGEYELTHEDPFRTRVQPASKVASLRVATPSLVVSLFGGAEAWIGDDRSDLRLIRRKNAKIALAMLVLNRGREITKDRMASTLWPEVPIDAARQNLYVIWAYLKKILKVGSSCPYLVSTQTGYKLDSRFVVADTQRFDELCRDLLFGRNDRDVWEELYHKVSSEFAEDLLPEIVGNDFIDGMRKHFRTQLVDGLVEASSRMASEGETRGAIWFAREAVRRDPMREDAYIALMEAQIASTQRGAALDTYFECRRCLSERLGIDPSKKVVDLYRSVIEIEEDF